MTWATVRLDLEKILVARAKYYLPFLDGLAPDYVAALMARDAERSMGFVTTGVFPGAAEIAGGPAARFVRAVDSRGGLAGDWYLPDSEFLRIKRLTRAGDPDSGKQIREAIRARLAIRKTWSDMVVLQRLAIPVGHWLPAVVGKARPQPLDSQLSPGVTLPGGGEQFFLRVKNLAWITPMAS